jgi:hypothetical protein
MVLVTTRCLRLRSSDVGDVGTAVLPSTPTAASLLSVGLRRHSDNLLSTALRKRLALIMPTPLGCRRRWQRWERDRSSAEGHGSTGRVTLHWR